MARQVWTMEDGTGPRWILDPEDATAAATNHNALDNLTVGDPHTQYIPKSLADAKGDLLVATAADTWTRRAAGADNQILQADSSQATGVKWADLLLLGNDPALITEINPS